MNQNDSDVNAGDFDIEDSLTSLGISGSGNYSQSKQLCDQSQEEIDPESDELIEWSTICPLKMSSLMNTDMGDESCDLPKNDIFEEEPTASDIELDSFFISLCHSDTESVSKEVEPILQSSILLLEDQERLTVLSEAEMDIDSELDSDSSVTEKVMIDDANSDNHIDLDIGASGDIPISSTPNKHFPYKNHNIAIREEPFEIAAPSLVDPFEKGTTEYGEQGNITQNTVEDQLEREPDLKQSELFQSVSELRYEPISDKFDGLHPHVAPPNIADGPKKASFTKGQNAAPNSQFDSFLQRVIGTLDLSLKTSNSTNDNLPSAGQGNTYQHDSESFKMFESEMVSKLQYQYSPSFGLTSQSIQEPIEIVSESSPAKSLPEVDHGKYDLFTQVFKEVSASQSPEIPEPIIEEVIEMDNLQFSPLYSFSELQSDGLISQDDRKDSNANDFSQVESSWPSPQVALSRHPQISDDLSFTQNATFEILHSDEEPSIEAKISNLIEHDTITSTISIASSVINEHSSIPQSGQVKEHFQPRRKRRTLPSGFLQINQSVEEKRRQSEPMRIDDTTHRSELSQDMNPKREREIKVRSIYPIPKPAQEPVTLLDPNRDLEIEARSVDPIRESTQEPVVVVHPKRDSETQKKESEAVDKNMDTCIAILQSSTPIQISATSLINYQNSPQKGHTVIHIRT